MKTILETLQTQPLAVLSAQKLEELLREGTVLREENTTLSDMIRIVDWQGTLLIQEKTDRMEFIVRKTGSPAEAEEFVNNRLETYERMWDG